MMQRWDRVSKSCRACREKKRRCDRKRPCSNCAVRSIECLSVEETHRIGMSGALRTSFQVQTQPSHERNNIPEVSTRNDGPDDSHSADVLYRLKRLEDVVFAQSKQLPREEAMEFVPFALHLISDSEEETEGAAILKHAKSRLPPLNQARLLMAHMEASLHSYWGIFHVPTCQETLERLYNNLSSPSSADLLVMLVCFAVAAFTCTTALLQNLHATQKEAKAALSAYLRAAVAVLDNKRQPVGLSVSAWAAAAGMFVLTTHLRGMSDATLSLRMKCIAMAQQMQVHRLDTKERRDERLLKGCNYIDVEVQRRVWWHLLANDWLSAFSGSQADGAYLFHPKHMNVQLPSNTRDEFVTATGVTKVFPSSESTPMTAFLYRVKVAEICREVVDAMPSAFADDEKRHPPYNTVLAMDKKFRNLLNDLPIFLRMDDESIAQTKETLESMPFMPLLRASFHLSVQTRLCRLHRPYHLEGLTNKTYAYSNEMCLQAAQAVLDMRRRMDQAARPLGVNPAKSWILMQHVFVAGLILATDVFFNPSAPDAEERKSKVLAVCDILERSIDDSGMGMDGVRRNMQTLISTLNGQRRQSLDTRMDAEMLDSPLISNPVAQANRLDGHTVISETDGSEVDWDRLWADFIAIAPGVEVPQWDEVFRDINAAVGF